MKISLIVFMLFTTQIVFTFDGHVVFVKTDSLIVREKPTKNSKKIGSLIRNELITIVETTFEREIIDGIDEVWVKIKSDLFEGFVFSGYLSEERDQFVRKYSPHEKVQEGESDYSEYIDRKLIHDFPNFFTISKEGYRILKLKNGQMIKYIDQGEERSVSRFHFYDIIDNTFAIIKEGLYEGEAYFAVNLATGKTIRIPLPTYEKSTKNIIFYSSGDDYFIGPGIVIIDLSGNVIFESDDSVFKIRFNSDETIEMYINKTYYEGKRLIKITGKTYQILSPLSKIKKHKKRAK